MGRSLLTLPPSWNRYADNHPLTAPNILLPGQPVSAGANGVDLAVVQIMPALAFDCELLIVGVSGFSLSAASVNVVLDILIDPAGGTAWQLLIPDLLVGHTGVMTASQGLPKVFTIPIWIPAGSTIGSRARTSHTANITTGRVVLQVYGENSNPGSWWCAQWVDTIAFSTAPHGSQSGTIAPGVTPSYSAWATQGVTNQNPLIQTYEAFVPMIGGITAGTADTANNYLLELGLQLPGDTDWKLLARFMMGAATTEQSGYICPMGPHFRRLPAGSQIGGRAMASAASPQGLDYNVLLLA